MQHNLLPQQLLSRSPSMRAMLVFPLCQLSYRPRERGRTQKHPYWKRGTPESMQEKIEWARCLPNIRSLHLEGGKTSRSVNIHESYISGEGLFIGSKIRKTLLNCRFCHCWGQTTILQPASTFSVWRQGLGHFVDGGYQAVHPSFNDQAQLQEIKRKHFPDELSTKYLWMSRITFTRF